MNRKAIIVSIVFSGLLIVVLVTLLAVPSVRFSLFRIVTELPTVATNFAIKKYAKARDFESGAAGLERELSIMQWANTSRSSMLRGLLANTEMFIGIAALAPDYVALTPYLQRLVNDQPNLFIARVWLGRALTHSDPEEAFLHLEEAAKLVPADDRSYRIAVNASLALGDREKAENWCRRYASAQFGGTRPLIYRNVFGGTGIRKLALEVPSAAGKVKLITNEGVQIGLTQLYDFDLPERVNPESLRLHAGILPGVKIAFGDMILYGPDGPRLLGPDQYFVIPANGFALSLKRMVTVSRDGDIYTILPRSGAFGVTDRVDIEMTFERLGLATLPGCEGP